VAVVAKAPSYQSDTFVWGTYTDKIGWTSPFVVVSTGLVNPGYVYAGLDGAVHIAEEVLNPKKVIPLTLLATVGMAFVTGFAISIALAYTVQDLTAAASSE
jgi:choline transport protein